MMQSGPETVSCERQRPWSPTDLQNEPCSRTARILVVKEIVHEEFAEERNIRRLLLFLESL